MRGGLLGGPGVPRNVRPNNAASQGLPLPSQGSPRVLMTKRVCEIMWILRSAAPPAVTVCAGFKPRSVRHSAQFDFFSLLDVAVLGIFRTPPPGESLWSGPQAPAREHLFRT